MSDETDPQRQVREHLADLAAAATDAPWFYFDRAVSAAEPVSPRSSPLPLKVSRDAGGGDEQQDDSGASAATEEDA